MQVDGAGKTGGFLCVAGQEESGGKHPRTPNASRISQAPGSREAFGLRVSLAPLPMGGEFNATCLAEIRLVSPKSDEGG